MKKFLMVVLFMTTLIGATGCAKTKNSYNLTVTSEEESIKCIRLEGAADSFLDSKKDLFKFAFENNASSKIRYIKIDEKVYLDFGSNPPDKLSIRDRILNSNGEYLYSDKEIIEVPFTSDNNKFYFIVKKHLASALSSVYTENETIFRGFRIKASWGKKEYMYAFVIKTNGFN